MTTQEPDKGEEQKSENSRETDSPHEQNENKEEPKHIEPDAESESREDGFDAFEEPDETPSQPEIKDEEIILAASPNQESKVDESPREEKEKDIELVLEQPEQPHADDAEL